MPCHYFYSSLFILCSVLQDDSKWCLECSQWLPKGKILNKVNYNLFTFPVLTFIYIILHLFTFSVFLAKIVSTFSSLPCVLFIYFHRSFVAYVSLYKYHKLNNWKQWYLIQTYYMLSIVIFAYLFKRYNHNIYPMRSFRHLSKVSNIFALMFLIIFRLFGLGGLFYN